MVANAITALADFESLTPTEIVSALLAPITRPNATRWKRDDLVAVFGELQVQQALDRLPSLFLTYLVDGVDFSSDRERARFAADGDLRAAVGDESADALLALGETTSSLWLDTGGSGDDPTAEEVTAIRATVLNQRANRKRLADGYNAAAALIENNPAATWAEVLQIVGGE